VSEEEFQEVARPYLEDLIGLGWKYNVPATSVIKAIEIAKKAASRKAFDDALWAIRLAISNCKTPPYNIWPAPVDAEILDVIIVTPEKLKDYGIVGRANAKTFAVVVFYAANMEVAGERPVGVVGWKLHYSARFGGFFTEPMFTHELHVFRKLLYEKHGGQGEAEAGHEES